MILDATDLILGRFGTVVAKKALLGEKIEIVNCEKAVITGSKAKLIAEARRKRDMGAPRFGPFFTRQADRFVKRSIRGMLPYKRERGADALKRIICHIGVPAELEGQKTETIAEANVSKVPNLKYLTIKDLCVSMGAKL